MREIEDTVSDEERKARGQDRYLKARQDFWSIMGENIFHHHVTPGVKLYVPQDDFPIPLKYTMFRGKRGTSLDVLQEEKHLHMSKRVQRGATKKWAEEKTKLDATRAE